MVQSYNTKALVVAKAVYYLNGANDYGKIMIGDNALEFYSDRNVNKNIQIPFSQIKKVRAAVYFNKWIYRFIVETKENGDYAFSSPKSKAILRIVRDHIGNENVVRAETITGRARAARKK